MYAHL
jgi:hypothetical protein